MTTRKSALLVRWELYDAENTAFESYNLKSSFTTPVDSFSFSLLEEQLPMTRPELEPVELFIHGASQGCGRIDKTDIGSAGSLMSLTGRDYLSNMTECKVAPTLKLSAGDTVFEAVTKAAGPVGIDTIHSDDDTPLRSIRTGQTIPSVPQLDVRNATLKDYKTSPGESIFQYCNRIVARQGATIQPGPNRSTLILAAPNYDQEPLYFATRRRDKASAANTIKTGSASRDFSHFPTHALVKGKNSSKGSATPMSMSIDFEIFANSSVSELAEIFKDKCDGDRRKPGTTGDHGLLYRLMYKLDSEARNFAQLERTALREIASRMKATLQYSCTLPGHATEGDTPYAVDTIIQIEDELAGVHEPMWIESREFTYSKAAGRETKLVCWRPGSFQI